MSLTAADWTKLEEVLDRKIATKLDKVDEKISHLPTKEQFYKKIDKWMAATTTHDLEKSAHKRAHKRLDDHLVHSHVL